MKKTVVMMSASVILILILGIGFSYSLWNLSVSQNTVSTMHTDCFDLTISNKENNISLENAYPISYSKGMKLTPYTFTVTNTCDITAQYSINLEVLKNSTLSSKFIDVMLDGNINLLSGYDETDKIDNSSIESRKIDTGILKSNESKDYSLRLWIDYDTTLEDLNNESKIFKSKVTIVGKPINYTGDTVFNFDYTGGEQTFTAPVSGTYKLETWGAQGGNSVLNGKNVDNIFYAGYSNGIVTLTSESKLFISIGGMGEDAAVRTSSAGGYNGGGSGDWDHADDESCGGGGGASSIQNILIGDGQLKNYENNKENVLIVSGGSAGMGVTLRDNIVNYNFSNGGGFIGGALGIYSNSAYEIIKYSNQTVGFKFGVGGSAIDIGENLNQEIPGGGGGWYGGYTLTKDDIKLYGSTWSFSGGGSGYIGNSLLTNKIMYCYNCEESSEVSTKTISTTCSEETPTSYCAKKGNGYARITLVSIDE